MITAKHSTLVFIRLHYIGCKWSRTLELSGFSLVEGYTYRVKLRMEAAKKQIPQQVCEPSKGFRSNEGDAVVVDVELLQTGQVP